MTKIRPLNPNKYEISKHRFLELYHFCLQYNEWRDRLKYETDTVKAIENDGMPHGTEISNPTMELATRRADLSKKCELIEQTAIEADPDIYQYIIKAVTNEGITFKYLDAVMRIPCSRNTYYDRRRKFFWLLSEKI